MKTQAKIAKKPGEGGRATPGSAGMTSTKRSAGNAQMGKTQSNGMAATLLSTPLSATQPSFSYIEREADFLRRLYDVERAVLEKKIAEQTAKNIPTEDIAKVASVERNVIKTKVREQGPKLWKALNEIRNKGKYGNPIGPSYDELFERQLEEGVPRSEIPGKILKGATKSSGLYNAIPRVARAAGRVVVVWDIARATYRIIEAPADSQKAVALEEGEGSVPAS